MTDTAKSSANRFRFRAWDKVKKKMMYMDRPEYRGQFSLYFSEANDYRDFEVGVSHFQGETEDTESWRPNEIFLMQSTGLLDKNGREIFEFDILQCLHKYMNIDNVVVEWNNSGFWNPMTGGASCGCCGRYQYWDDPDTRLIIGNIYENPELLK